MDARAYVVAVLFGFAGGLLVPRSGPDRRAVQITVALMVASGIVTWVVANDVFAGPSLTIGGVSAMLGIAIRRQPETEGN
jgi:hypothetical protein